MAERKFNCGEKGKHCLSKKDKLGKPCAKYKEEYDKKINENKSTVNFNVLMKDGKTHNEITRRRIYCSCSSRVLQRPRRIEKRRSSHEKSRQTGQTLLRPTNEEPA